MNALFVLLSVRGLPPPPSPTSSPDVDTVRVIGIVVLSLGIIALATLALRPFIVRGHRQTLATTSPVAAPVSMSASQSEAPPAPSTILRFPTPAAMEAEPDMPEEAYPEIVERFDRVVGQPDRRRKLGDRNPSRSVNPRQATPTSNRRDGGGTVIPLYVDTAEPMESSIDPLEVTESRVWSEPEAPGAEPSRATDRRRPIGNRRPVIVRSDDTEPIPSISELASPPASNSETEADDEFIVVRTVQPIDAPSVIGSEVPDDVVWHPIAVESILGDTAETVDLDGALGEAVDPLDGQWTAARTFDWTGKVVTDQLPELIEPEPDEAPDDMTLNSAPGTLLPEPERAAELIADVEPEPDIDEPEPAAVQENPPAEQLATPPETDSEIDPATLRQVTMTIRELIFCANTGEVLRGLSLYSDDHLFRLIDSSGMTEAEFRAAFSATTPRAPETWERLAEMTDVTVLADGSVEATASYVDPRGQQANGLERYRLVHDQEHEQWMIDDIVQLGG